MSDALHILMTVDTVGGVWTYAMELARAVRAHNVTITLATMGAPPSAPQRREVAELPHVTLHESRYALEWMDEPWGDVNAAGGWLLDLSASVQPDVIHFNGYAHASLPRRAPVLVVAHSCVLSWWQAVKGEAAPAGYVEYQRRVESGLRAADMVVAPSTAMLDALREHYDFSGSARVISNGRSAELFCPRTKQPVIFTAGRVWDEAKNIALLKRIAPRLRWPVHIAGQVSPPDTPNVCSPHGANINGAVMGLGQLAPTALAQHLGTASIYAAPARYEPFGLGILEAALSGCALVLADLPSLRENWDGVAIFVSAADDTAWLNTLNALAADAPQRAVLSMRALQRAHHFTAAAMAAQYLDTYRELTARRGVLHEEEVFA
ncbi:MAG: glycosyltransferase family 4 protein [Chthoniobacteraceae bacterium]